MERGFSKYVVLHPVRALTAKVVVDFFCKNYFSSYGVPRSIVSDNARAFFSTQFKNMCFGWGIRHITTSPFYPKPNHVERFNRNLKIAFTIFHHDQKSVWDENLPTFSIGFNSAIHQSTKMTSAHLFPR
jgi:hypothetical protein